VSKFIPEGHGVTDLRNIFEWLHAVIVLFFNHEVVVVVVVVVAVAEAEK
jgi:hypothetical protein